MVSEQQDCITMAGSFWDETSAEEKQMKIHRHDGTAIGAILLGTMGAVAMAALFFPGGDQQPLRIIEIETPPQSAVPAAPLTPVEPTLGQRPVFTPHSVAPVLVNREEVMKALQEAYPPLLRDAGIEGRVLVYLFIEKNGGVKNLLINESSGHQALDMAALRVGAVMRFTPALNRDQPVPVWISLPIAFQAR